METEKKRNYDSEEIGHLHECLYTILGEIVRVCEKHDIPYFILGGSAIGAFFEQAILPWDDDIDMGMTRENYNRFLNIAPAELQPGFFLQWPGSEPHTPFYFAKVRMDKTSFVEGIFSKLDIHHGIYVDIFPFDKAPDNALLQKGQRTLSNFIIGCFMGKDIWQWKYFGKCDVPKPRPRGAFACLITRIMCLLFSKQTLYRMLYLTQSWYNRRNTTYYNLIPMPRDHISVESLRNSRQVPFGPLMVTAPDDLETYLRHHYPNLRRHIPEEEKMNHRPEILSFEKQYKASDPSCK